MKYYILLINLLALPFLNNGNDLFSDINRLRRPKLEELWCSRGHFNLDQANFVTELAKRLKPRYVFETGFCTGRSTATVLTACSPKKFVSIDIDLDYMKPEGRQMAELLTKEFTCFSIIEGNSRTILTPQFIKNTFPKGIDWATIDGDHSYEGCLLDLRVSEYLSPKGIIIIDDYKSGPPNGVSIPPVTNAVEDFCKVRSEFYKVTWNKKGKGFAILTRSREIFELIENIAQQNMKL